MGCRWAPEGRPEEPCPEPSSDAASMFFPPLCANALRLLPRRVRGKTSDLGTAQKENLLVGPANKCSDPALLDPDNIPLVAKILKEDAPWRRAVLGKHCLEAAESDEHGDQQTNDEGAAAMCPSRASTEDILEDESPESTSKSGEQSDESTLDADGQRGGGDTSSSASVPSSPKDPSIKTSSFAEPISGWPGPGELASVLRWDHVKFTWVLDEIEIAAATPIPRFAVAFSNGAEACPPKYPRPVVLLRPEAAPFNPGGVGYTGFNVLAPVFTPNQTQEATRSFNKDAPVFTPSHDLGEGSDMAVSNLNMHAAVFVPDQEAVARDAGSDASLTHWQRTRLNTSAVAFVPCWEAYDDDSDEDDDDDE